MPLIHTVKPEDATGELAEVYQKVEAMRGRVSNSLQMLSIGLVSFQCKVSDNLKLNPLLNFGYFDLRI